MKKIFIFIMLISVISLAACGKAAKPVPYEGSGYPHTYPYDK